MPEEKRYTAEDFVEADRRITEAHAKLREAEKTRDAMIAEHWGCQAGTEVVFRDDRYLVCGISDSFGGPRSKPWLKGRKQKKDGSWSEAVQTIYSEWEHAPSA